MEYDLMTDAYILQPNEVLEVGPLRVTNISKEEKSITKNLAHGDFDHLKLTTGPLVERGLEFRLRAL